MASMSRMVAFAATKLLTTLTALTALAATGGTASAAPRGGGDCTSSVPYTAGQDGYDTYRIPATVTTRAGTLLAFAEGRHSGAGDTGNIDVVLRRSYDGGCTWGPTRVVASGGGDTRGNPAPVVDPRTGRIVLLTSYNSGAVTEAQIMRGEVTAEQSRRVFVQTSRDDGGTSPPRGTSRTRRSCRTGAGTPPGPATRSPCATDPTRGAWSCPPTTPPPRPPGPPTPARSPSTTGRTRSTATTAGSPGGSASSTTPTTARQRQRELGAAELPDGRLYFTSRDQNGTSTGNRLDSYSSDGGRNPGPPLRRPARPERRPVVQGSVLQLTGRSPRSSSPGPPSPPSASRWRSGAARPAARPSRRRRPCPAAGRLLGPRPARRLPGRHPLRDRCRWTVREHRVPAAAAQRAARLTPSPARGQVIPVRTAPQYHHGFLFHGPLPAGEGRSYVASAGLTSRPSGGRPDNSIVRQGDLKPCRCGPPGRYGQGCPSPPP